MNEGETCTTTWSVIPTGDVGDTYSFFVDYIPESPNLKSKRTNTINITITEEVECEERWNCDLDWGKCIKQTQTRNCIDLSKCGTEKIKPETSKECGVCEVKEKPCTTKEECPGIQKCFEGKWNKCIDIPDDGCPKSELTEQGVKLTVIFVILVVGVLIILKK